MCWDYLAGIHNKTIRSDLLGHHRPAKFSAKSLRCVLFFTKCKRFLDINQGDFFSTKTIGFTGNITTNITGTDNYNFFSNLIRTGTLCSLKKVKCWYYSFMSREGYFPRFMSSDCHDHIVKIFFEFGKSFFVHIHTKVGMNIWSFQKAFYLLIPDGLRKAFPWNNLSKLSADKFIFLKNMCINTCKCQLPCSIHPSRTTTNDGYFFS